MPLLAIMNLGIEILPYDVNILHHFHDDFVPLAILPPFNEEIPDDVPIEEAVEVTRTVKKPNRTRPDRAASSPHSNGLV